MKMLYVVDKKTIWKRCFHYPESFRQETRGPIEQEQPRGVWCYSRHGNKFRYMDASRVMNIWTIHFLSRAQLKESSEISQKSLERGEGRTGYLPFLIYYFCARGGNEAGGTRNLGSQRRKSIPNYPLFLPILAICKAFPESVLPFSSFHPFTWKPVRRFPKPCTAKETYRASNTRNYFR